MKARVEVVEKILSANDQLALENRKVFDEAGVYTLNMMASPGAGKTSLIEVTIRRLADRYHVWPTATNWA
jgi:hydrogenase nickel incorporation protein HypB